MNNSKLWENVKAILEDYNVSLPTPGEPFLPDRPIFGRLDDDEIIVITSERKIDKEDFSEDFPDHEIFREVEEIIASSERRGSPIEGRNKEKPRPEWGAPCAWYCPLHFFGPDWGIYIREDCVIDMMFDIAHYINWSAVPPISAIGLRNFAFYHLYFHEQFHHKVESFGLRVLATQLKDSYVAYKQNVYKANYGTSACLEESLASAESYKRFFEKRYFQKFPRPFLNRSMNYVKDSIKASPAGYREGINYLDQNYFQRGVNKLQSQLLEGSLSPTTSKPHSWEVASGMTRGLRNISSEIYTIVKAGSKSIFSSHFDPRFTTSTRAIKRALTKYYGFRSLSGRGKGSHEMLENTQTGQKVTISGNRNTLPIKDIKDTLQVLTGKGSLEQLPSLLNGSLPSTLKV